MDSSRSSQTGGYGIGLSVAKAIVSAHNGRISAATQDGHSLQINVQFPL
jgi:signal transduction histidine kinase